MKITIKDLMSQSGVQFGTSGVRGLVIDMTDKVCFAYVTAFLQYLEQHNVVAGDKIAIAGDLRKSTPRIINAVIAACKTKGLEPVYCGFIPSPAIALYGIDNKMASIMVTGSHIPDDRNGIKFNTPWGEILKQDELEISTQSVTIDDGLFDENGYFTEPLITPAVNNEAYEHYIKRYVDFFPVQCLSGKQIGLYEHSSVSRDIFKTILEKMGAQVTSLGRSDDFISVDTEAIRPEDVELAQSWNEQYHFDCIVSTDGDGDRPLISDEHGRWLRGDIVGIVCADYLAANTVVTPVSSNSAVEKSQLFTQVIRSKIGSPFVIAAMQEAEKHSPQTNIIGYEANGGVLLQTPISKQDKILTLLPTRDAIIAALSVMVSAYSQNLTIAELIEKLPARYTYSDRLKNFPTQLSQTILAHFSTGDWQKDMERIQQALPALTSPVSVDNTDGVRITFDNKDIVHIRPSGNAPELRCYTESTSELAARELNKTCIEDMMLWQDKFDSML